ncbi:MAG: DUF2911 domain-containing protein [Gemmatimonadetes bacterium]|nr:DUF2911 domain-containing protein [Gemmatimonadota bacterium]
MRRSHAVLPFLLAAACGGDRASDRYGFVTRLGRDTVAVERVERHGDTLTIDAVDRWPFVRRRHATVVLAADASIRRLAMDVTTPNAPRPTDRARRITADITPDSVHVVLHDGNGDHPFAWGVAGVLTLPHVPQSYALAERYIAAALARGRAMKLAAGDSVPLHQFYPDFDAAHFPLHDGYVHPVSATKVELWHDWLSGIGEATVDSADRLLAYSGQQSTYKVEMQRVATPPDVDAAQRGMLAGEQATGASQLSVRDTARGTIGAATFSVDYGRPLARGRTLLGDVIRYDYVWRTGANAATQFTTSRAITLAGIPLAAGTYTLWTVPHAGGRADLIVNRETGQWGTNYDDAHDIGTAPLVSGAPPAPVEKFTIAIEPADATHGALTLAWGTFKWTAPIVVK